MILLVLFSLVLFVGPFYKILYCFSYKVLVKFSENVLYRLLDCLLSSLVVFIKVVIDRNSCLGCGTCVSLCGAVFRLAESLETAQLREKFQTGGSFSGKISKNIDCVKLAANKCPVKAIEIIDE